MQKKSSSKKKIKRKIPGTSHPVTQQATEEEVKTGIQKQRKMKVQRQKISICSQRGPIMH